MVRWAAIGLETCHDGGHARLTAHEPRQHPAAAAAAALVRLEAHLAAHVRAQLVQLRLAGVRVGVGVGVGVGGWGWVGVGVGVVVWARERAELEMTSDVKEEMKPMMAERNCPATPLILGTWVRGRARGRVGLGGRGWG